MKVKKLLICSGIFVLGGVITAAIDTLIGVSFKDVDMGGQIIHKVTYMLWGAVLVGMNKWLNS